MRKMFNRKLKQAFFVKEIRFKDRHIEVICYGGGFGLCHGFCYRTLRELYESWADVKESS